MAGRITQRSTGRQKRARFLPVCKLLVKERYRFKSYSFFAFAACELSRYAFESYKNKRIIIININMKTRLNFIKVALSQPPRIYGITYLLLVPVFALLYAFQDEGFYCSSIKHEPAFEMQYSDLKSEFEEIFYKKLKIEHGNKKAKRIQCEIGNLTIEMINSGLMTNLQGKIAISCGLSARYDLRNRQISKRIPPNVKHPINSIMFRSHHLIFSFNLHYTPIKNGQPMTLTLTSATDVSVYPNINSLFPSSVQKQGNEQPSVNFSDIDLSHLTQSIREYWSVYRGIPYSNLDNFARMLYLSTVTITTLGYGDIIPLTNIARFLVGLESILGIIVIGLFLNAISKR